MSTLTIPIKKGYEVVIDAADAPKVAGINWSPKVSGRTVYAEARVRGRTVGMHRLLIDVPSGMFVDHVDGNGLNNRRSNLRPADKQLNGANRQTQRHSSSFKGVSKNKHHDSWRARIRINGAEIQLGSFATEADAARAYDAAARAAWGEYARPNFPDEEGTR